MSAKLRLIESGSRPTYVKVEPGIYRHTNGTLYGRKSMKHLRIPEFFESLRTEKITEARREFQRQLEAHKARYMGGKTVTERDDRTGTAIGTIIEEVKLTVTPKRRTNTQYTHNLYWKELTEHWGSLDVNRLTLVMWERWMAEFKVKKGKRDPKTGKQRKTFNDYVFKMNLVLRYALNHRYLKHPLILPQTDPVTKGAGRVFTDRELGALWNAMGETTRDQFVLAYECFMRLREVLHLTWERLDLDTGKLTLTADDVKTGSRTGKGRSFFVSPNALERLRRRRAAAKGSRYVFPARANLDAACDDNKTAWTGVKKRAQITGRARWHDIRHTSLSKALLEQKLPPLEVSEYAGVSMRTIQKVYLHSTEEQTRAVSGALSVARFQSK